MRLRGSESPLFLSRRDQLRLLLPLLGLIIVIVLIELAANPANWAWFAQQKKQQKKPAPQLPHNEAPAIADPKTPRGPLTAPRPAADGHNPSHRIQITRPLLASIDDNFGHLTASESNAYWTMLELARRDLSKQPGKVWSGASFDDLVRRPAAYRGHKIAFAGDLRIVDPVRAGRNDFGIAAVYQAWIYPKNDLTSKGRPYRVMVHHLPKDIPMGTLDQPIPVSGVGYYFKRRGFQTTEGKSRYVPFLLAGKLVAEPLPPAKPGDPGRGKRFTIYIVLGIVFAVGAVFWNLRRFRNRPRFEMPTRNPSDTPSSPEEIEGFLDKLDVPDEQPVFEPPSEQDQAN